MSETYKSKKDLGGVKDDRAYKDKIDVTVILDVMYELELENIEKFVKENLNQIVKDKGVYDYIQDFNPVMRENRVYYSRIVNTVENQKEVKGVKDQGGNIDGKVVYPKKMFWDGMFAMMILRKTHVIKYFF